MDKLADALASIEYYMEATREQRGGREKILDVTRQSLAALGYWPVPDDEGGGAPPPVAPLPETPTGATWRASPADVPVLASLDHSAAQSTFATDAGAHLMTTSADEVAAAHEGEFPSWGEHLPASGEAGLKLHQDSTPSENAATDNAEFP